jgi:hypothetical protein
LLRPQPELPSTGAALSPCPAARDDLKNYIVLNRQTYPSFAHRFRKLVDFGQEFALDGLGRGPDPIASVLLNTLG